MIVICSPHFHAQCNNGVSWAACACFGRHSFVPSTRAAYTSATRSFTHLSLTFHCIYPDSTLLPASEHTHAVMHVHVPRIHTQATIYTCIKVYPTLSREPSTFVAYSAASSTCMAHPVSTSTSSCVYRCCCSPSGRRPVCTAAVAHPVDVVLCVPLLSLTQWTSSCVYHCCRSPSGRRPVCTTAVAHPVDVVLCVPLLSLTQWTSSCLYRCCRSPSGRRPVCTAAVAHPVDVVLCVLSSSSSTRHTRRVIGLVILAHVVVICTMCEIIHV